MLMVQTGSWCPAKRYTSYVDMSVYIDIYMNAHIDVYMNVRVRVIYVYMSVRVRVIYIYMSVHIDVYMNQGWAIWPKIHITI